MSDKKIATYAYLLGNDPKTIERNYQHHIGLLRSDYKDRDSGKSFLLNNASLLGLSLVTFESSVQYLSSLGIPNSGDTKYAMLLGTKTSTKRKKVSWIIRNVFDYDYENSSKEEKRDIIQKVYSAVRDNPYLLAYSISSLEKKKDKLREKYN